MYYMGHEVAGVGKIQVKMKYGHEQKICLSLLLEAKALLYWEGTKRDAAGWVTQFDA